MAAIRVTSASERPHALSSAGPQLEQLTYASGLAEQLFGPAIPVAVEQDAYQLGVRQCSAP